MSSVCRVLVIGNTLEVFDPFVSRRGDLTSVFHTVYFFVGLNDFQKSTTENILYRFVENV